MVNISVWYAEDRGSIPRDPIMDLMKANKKIKRKFTKYEGLSLGYRAPLPMPYQEDLFETSTVDMVAHLQKVVEAFDDLESRELFKRQLTKRDWS